MVQYMAHPETCSKPRICGSFADNALDATNFSIARGLVGDWDFVWSWTDGFHNRGDSGPIIGKLSGYRPANFPTAPRRCSYWDVCHGGACPIQARTVYTVGISRSRIPVSSMNIFPGAVTKRSNTQPQTVQRSTEPAPMNR